MTILVTGAGGFAGSHLLDLLARERAEVIAGHRPQGQAGPPRPGVRWQPLDVLDGAAVSRVMEETRPAVVYHCAGAAHVGSAWADPLPSLETNALGTHYLLNAVRRYAPEARVLVPSSALVYAPSPAPLDEEAAIAPGAPYGVSKLAQELIALRAARGGLHVLVPRPFNHIGPRQDASFVASAFARQIAEIEAGRRPPVIEVGNLDARRDLTDVRDTVRAYRLMVERAAPGRPINVCSGQTIRVGDLLDGLLRLSRVRVEIRVDASRLRPSDRPVLAGSRARIEREIGWRPEIPIARSLADLLEDWRSRIGTGREAAPDAAHAAPDGRRDRSE